MNPRTSFLRLVCLSVLLGIVVALSAQAFLWLLHEGTVVFLGWIGDYRPLTVDQARHLAQWPAWRFGDFWIPVATTLGGLAVGYLAHVLAPETGGDGSDNAIETFHHRGGRMRYRVPFVKTLVSVITIGSGGSAGREGPTSQIASGLGAMIGGIFNLPESERRYLVLIGMAGGLAAIFRSPLGGAFFAVEILFSTMAFQADALPYTLLSAAVAYALTGWFVGFGPLLPLPHGAAVGSFLQLGWFVLLGILAGLFGVVLPTIYYRIKAAFDALRLPVILKPALGGLCVGLIGLVAPPLLSGGYGYMELALRGGLGMAAGILFVLSFGKLIATSITIGSGGSGGVFAPMLFVGVFLGAGLAALLMAIGISGISASALALAGMAAVFAGVARVPLAALFMTIGMTQGHALLVPVTLAVIVSFWVQSGLSGRFHDPILYRSQRHDPARLSP
jgi:CIC family chloride channel protein